MAPRLIEVDEARRAVLDCTAPLTYESERLADALGRVLAEDVRSVEPVPPFASSAMDGFALRCVDVRDAAQGAPASLTVVGESRAGHPAARAVAANEAVAISTGAIVPEGADSVVPVEQTSVRNGHVDVLTSVAAGNDVRRAGEDIGADELVLTAGTPLGPAHLGVLASLGRAEVRCFRRPAVSVLTTGDELVAPGRELPHGAIYNSNAYSIPALAREAGGVLGLTTTVRDEVRATADGLTRALGTSDVVVICGGVSVGEHDHVRPTLAQLGAVERFWGVALKPGKPTWFGIRERTLVFGLPGNPVSAMVTFTLFVAPALRALAGGSPDAARTTALLARDIEKRPGRTHAVRCRLRASERGWLAEPTGDQSSHVLTSMLDADALAILPSESAGASAGDRVAIELLPGARPGGP
jgi:molybdopterin molybdotransferase